MLLRRRGWHASAMRPMAAIGQCLGALVAASTLGACSSPVREPAVPSTLTERATVLGGLAKARYFADTQVPEMTREADTALDRERTQLGPAAGGRLPPANLLAVSGGGDNGAFGAGLLIGWTERGDRPEFKLVTGISTGALIAPFAFLGPSYDGVLRHVYTEVDQSHIFASRYLLTAVFDDALKDTSPLFQLISRHIDIQLMAAIAGEYRKGRLLLIGTTDLDAQRPVIWNIGAIAASGRPGALDLLRKILLASAAIPVAFPPVLIDVDVDGTPYQEMHVDGGAIAQAFLYPQLLAASVQLRRGPLARERHAYVIRNGRLDPEWSSTDRRLFSIAGRAVDTMIHYSGQNDVYRLQTRAARDGVDFNLAYIGRDFTVEHTEDFDPTYMRALFEYGRAQIKNGTAWKKSSPLLSPGQMQAGRRDE
ncbi:MAG TPA: patatin-like phospholipase family protein [Stellaceae bacterium]